MFELGDKSATKSLTVIGAAIFAALTTAEGLGYIPAGVAAQAATVAKGIAAILAAFGIRRAVGENGMGGIFDDDEDEAAERPAAEERQLEPEPATRATGRTGRVERPDRDEAERFPRRS